VAVVENDDQPAGTVYNCFSYPKHTSSEAVS